MCATQSLSDGSTSGHEAYSECENGLIAIIKHLTIHATIRAGGRRRRPPAARGRGRQSFDCGQMGSALINGAAAKVMSFDRLGKRVRPGIFGKIKVG